MKKIIICLTLLGAVSLGSMAFIHHGDDDPPVRRTEARHGWHHGGDYREDCHRYSRRGGCCGRYRDSYDRRRDVCCGEAYDCGVCRDRRCTVDGCHERGELCPACAEWHNARTRDDVYRRD